MNVSITWQLVHCRQTGVATYDELKGHLENPSEPTAYSSLAEIVM